MGKFAEACGVPSRTLPWRAGVLRLTLNSLSTALARRLRVPYLRSTSLGLAATMPGLDVSPMIEGGTTALSPDLRPSDVLWYLERGRVAERLGHRERAIEAYRYAAAAWRGPDPKLESYAAEARAGLARLTAEPAS